MLDRAGMPRRTTRVSQRLDDTHVKIVRQSDGDTN
jgi:hypothetical protein